MTMHHDGPIACSLGAQDLAERQAEWRAVAAALVTKTATPSGVRLAFDADPQVAHTLLDLVAAERACCGWAEWTLTSTSASTTVEASASEPGAAVLQMMLDISS